MHENMSHSLDGIPFYLRMREFEFFSKHIHCFSNYLNVLYKTKEDNRIVFNLIKSIFVFKFEKNVD